MHKATTKNNRKVSWWLRWLVRTPSPSSTEGERKNSQSACGVVGNGCIRSNCRLHTYFMQACDYMTPQCQPMCTCEHTEAHTKAIHFNRKLVVRSLSMVAQRLCLWWSMHMESCRIWIQTSTDASALRFRLWWWCWWWCCWWYSYLNRENKLLCASGSLRTKCAFSCT